MDPQLATDALRARAMELGCGWFGVARARALGAELADLQQWISAGNQGAMAWMAKEPERRADPERVVEGCRSVVIMGLNYQREPLSPEAPTDPPQGMGRISKYARTRDYHRVLEKLLKKLCAYIRDEVDANATSRFYVDYGPVMERPWGAIAGIGFLGKHTLLIHPRQGSFHFLGAVLTTAELAPTSMAAEDAAAGCGDCQRCIDACPTGAITEPWRLDARRCLSYLTIEKDGPIDEEFWPHFQGRVFGCDICQDVCPYNKRRAEPIEESPLGPFLVPEDIPLADMIRHPEKLLESLENTSSPLKRAGPDALARNAMLAAVENGDEEAHAAIREVVEDEGRAEWLRELGRRVDRARGMGNGE